MTALDKVSGALLWKCGAPGEDWLTYASGVVGNLHGVRPYVVPLHPRVLDVAVADGQLLQKRVNLNHRLHGTLKPFLRDSQVLLPAGYERQVVLLDLLPQNGGFEPRDVYASRAQLDPFQDSTFVVGDHLYVLSSIAACYERRLSKSVWEQRIRSARGAATYADGRARQTRPRRGRLFARRQRLTWHLLSKDTGEPPRPRRCLRAHPRRHRSANARTGSLEEG